MITPLSLEDILQANRAANAIIAQQADEMAALQARIDKAWDPETQAYYETLEARLGRVLVVTDNLYQALHGLRDRYVPNDETRPEVAAADEALSLYDRFVKPPITDPSP